jgi:hypothetical protein
LRRLDRCFGRKLLGLGHRLAGEHGLARLPVGLRQQVVQRSIGVDGRGEAKSRRVTKSSLVRESLVKGLHEQPSTCAGSCYDLARDLAGSVKGLPKDLADNPKYLEGFGQ